MSGILLQRGLMVLRCGSTQLKTVLKTVQPQLVRVGSLSTSCRLRNTLDQNVRRNSYKKCYNCGQEGHIAKDCDEPVLCKRCGQQGHIARECKTDLETITCKICGGTGHSERNCVKNMLCLRCRQLGHMAKDCTNEVVCNSCGLSGHIAANCPSL